MFKPISTLDTSLEMFSVYIIYITLKYGRVTTSGQSEIWGVPKIEKIVKIWLISESPLNKTLPSVN